MPLDGRLDAPVIDHADMADNLESALTLWPEADRKMIATSVAGAANHQECPYATFDADGTLWSSDATDAFIAYLDAKQILTPDQLDEEIQVIPLLKDEGVYSYYQRLCGIDHAIGYPFAAQAFAGFSLSELRGHYETMMISPAFTVRVWRHGAFVEECISVPKIFPQQAQLIRALEANGIKVHIVTASPEELIRFLACDPSCHPDFDLNLPPERVIGINVELRDEATGNLTTSRMRLAHAPTLFDDSNKRKEWESRRLTPIVVPPVTMFEGKVAAISTFIHPTQPPVLAAGDSDSDLPMLYHSAGARVWVRNAGSTPDTISARFEVHRHLPDSNDRWIYTQWNEKQP
jgi:phosphoserine phosphatase